MSTEFNNLLAHVPSSAAVLGDWPSLSDIEKDLKLDSNSSELANVSLSALLIPSYANLTDGGYVSCFIKYSVILFTISSNTDGIFVSMVLPTSFRLMSLLPTWIPSSMVSKQTISTRPRLHYSKIAPKIWPPCLYPA